MIAFSRPFTIDPDVAIWAAQVVTNGGTVSSGRAAIVSYFVTALKSGGMWALTDDYLLLCAENAIQALTSLKQRRLAAVVAAPTFTTDRGYAFNGTSQYITTGFIPSTHAVAMTGSNMRIAVYERSNNSGGTYSAGTIDSAQKNLLIIARSTANQVLGCNCTTTNSASTVASNQALSVVSRTAAGVFEGFYRGVSLGTVSPVNATVLPTREIYVGCRNNVGVAANFRSATQGYLSVGASLTSAQEVLDYNAVQTFMTAIGANV